MLLIIMRITIPIIMAMTMYDDAYADASAHTYAHGNYVDAYFVDGDVDVDAN